jgi:hypothetical protein
LLNYCLDDNQWLTEVFEKFKKLLIDVDEFIEASTTSTIESKINSVNPPLQ